jgi:phosphoribosyl-AMP cyclohydrolase
MEEETEVMTDYEKLHRIAGKGLMVVPVAVQDVDTMKVLMIAYVNRKALIQSLQEDKATFWSTSRDMLWSKGKTSGNVLDLIDVLTDCKQSSFLFLVRPREGGACHTKDKNGRYRESCFYRKFSDRSGNTLTFLKEE